MPPPPPPPPRPKPPRSCSWRPAPGRAEARVIDARAKKSLMLLPRLEPDWSVDMEAASSSVKSAPAFFQRQRSVIVSCGSPTAAWIALLHATVNVRSSWPSIDANSDRSITTRPSAAVACVRPSVSRIARMTHLRLNGPSWPPRSFAPGTL
ncbi:MAG: hypothetical protein J3K34DRAFT_444099 [Monoraphidium minutum]|nr:MAG: hypothetical protein J3K34DRAFT_444099 [Monoraphidium minutum]